VANQRTSLKDRRAADARGVDAIITPTSVSKDTDVDSSGGEPTQQSTTLTKMTVYVRPDQVIALEEIQLSERKRTGKRKDKSELVQEAFDLLIERHRSTQ